MSDQRELSLRLYDILGMVGASEHMRKIHQRTARISEILQVVHFKRFAGQRINTYYCGSSFEGTVTPDLASDVDQIGCPSEPLVVPHLRMAGPGRFLHIIRDDETPTGYVKLQVIQDGQPLTVNDIGASATVGFDNEGRACMKHYACTHGVMQGPAIMFIDEKGEHYHDNVPAFQCHGIPLFADDWITRHRPYDWPTQQLIDELKMMGCLFVRAGHFTSPERDLEWRLSFSIQERVLMMNLNPTQHKVYILLKMVKKNILENCLKTETLSSYHCKTSVFYMAEMSPESTWVPDNLISCVLQCLALLLQWVKDRFCPNFFLKDANLFDKEGFSRHVDKLESLLEWIIQSGHTFLYWLQSDRVGEIFRNRDLSIYRTPSEDNICKYKAKINFRVIGEIASVCRKYALPFDADQDALSIYKAELEEYERGDGVPGYTQEESQPAIQLKLPWLHLSLGLEFAVRAVTCPDRHEGNELMKKVYRHLQQARNSDLVNGILALATILLRLENLEECLLLLQILDKSWTDLVILLCPCTQKMSQIDTPDASKRRELYLLWSDESIAKLMQKYVASCIIFERSQIELVPYPLRFEMFRSLYTMPGSRHRVKDLWFDRAAVDANVYLYLLQYLVCSKLNWEMQKQIALNKLVMLVKYDEHGHKETAYNILGWVYLQEGRVTDALLCFLMSWRIRPHHNAAKFHVLIESFRQTKAHQRDNVTT